MQEDLRTLIMRDRKYTVVEKFTLKCYNHRHNMFFKCYGYSDGSGICFDRIIYPKRYRHVIIGVALEWGVWGKFLKTVMPDMLNWDWWDWKEDKKKTQHDKKV